MRPWRFQNTPLLLLLSLFSASSFRIPVRGISNSLFPSRRKKERKKKSSGMVDGGEGGGRHVAFRNQRSHVKKLPNIPPLSNSKPLRLPWEYPFTKRGGSGSVEGASTPQGRRINTGMPAFVYMSRYLGPLNVYKFHFCQMKIYEGKNFFYLRRTVV